MDNLTLITPPAVEPISLAEAKLHLRLDLTTEDVLIAALITAAREHCEILTWRALATQTVEMILNNFPSVNSIELSRPPLQSVTSVKYKNSAGVETTMAITDYIVIADKTPGEIILPYSRQWPSFIPFPSGAVRIRYVCGHSTLLTIPISIKQAMLLIIGHLYEHRESTTEKTLWEVPMAVSSLLRPYKISFLGR